MDLSLKEKPHPLPRRAKAIFGETQNPEPLKVCLGSESDSLADIHCGSRYLEDVFFIFLKCPFFIMENFKHT